MANANVEKAAILMLALGDDEAAEIMEYLEPREVQKLGAAMSTMKAVQTEQLTNLLQSKVISWRIGTRVVGRRL